MTENINKIAENYSVHNDYDYNNTMAAFKIIKDFIVNKNVLEIGCADGVMTEKIIPLVKTLEVLEPSNYYYQLIKSKFNLKNIICSNIKEFKPKDKYDVIVMAALLHHIENPIDELKIVVQWLKKDGILLATVPNMLSLHRRLGVKIGSLKSCYGDTARNIEFEQFGRYDKDSFEEIFKNSNLDIIKSFSYMLKPFSSKMMQSLKLDTKQLDALFEIGKQFPDIASQLFIAVKNK